MRNALIFNPGSNSLKVEVVHLEDRQASASKPTKIASLAVDGVGKQPQLMVFNGRAVASKQNIEAANMAEAVRQTLAWLDKHPEASRALRELDFIGVRVVHGGSRYQEAVPWSPEVRRDIEALQELAPLHNSNSISILDAMANQRPDVPLFLAFDTAFHHTLPEKAWRYPIERETADRHGIRKFGFHGLSHRYMLELYAETVGRPTESISVVTLHLESGCSACAIASGKSVDTTMGFTPLEGLMMGSRSGSLDPSIVPFLMRHDHKLTGEIMDMLNKSSGMLGIAGGTLDTRELVKREDPEAQLALEMFGYRVRMAVGAYLAALGNAEAVLFGGGIGEDSPWLRSMVCDGLSGWGLNLDRDVNDRSTAGLACISSSGSRLQAWAVPVEEGLQIAHECSLALNKQRASLRSAA